MKTNLLENYLQDLPNELDLTQSSDLQKVKELAEQLLQDSNDKNQLPEIEKYAIERKNDIPLMLHLAIKMAVSKRYVRQISQKVHISVVFAIYKEHNRMKTAAEHPHGENFLLRKVEQMNWLFADMPNFSWDMFVVDDGCPNFSGKKAQEILEKNKLTKQVHVLFLQDAIDKKLPISFPLHSTNESRKGGSIEYGMWQAIQQQRENQVVIFTDADLSTHLGQSGLLLNPILKDRKLAAIGSRREKQSVVIKKGARNTRGKLFIYLWKRMLPTLNYIVDTQCGFKAFRADLVKNIVPDCIEKKFAFDIELLLKTELTQANSIKKVPIAWIDSEAASTTTDLQPYLSMLKAVAGMYRKYLKINDKADEFADFIDQLTEEDWTKMLENIPEKIASGEPAEFSTFDAVSVNDLM